MSDHKYEVVDATDEHVSAMLLNVRQADIDEAYAATGSDIESAIRYSMATATKCWAGLVDGEVACIFGVSPENMLGLKAVPWMVATNLIEDHALAFLRRNRRYILTMLTMYNHLENYVDVRNVVAINWLKWLGFEFDEPESFGPFGLDFMRFELKW